MSSHIIVMREHNLATIAPSFRHSRKTFPQGGAGTDEAVWGPVCLP